MELLPQSEPRSSTAQRATYNEIAELLAVAREAGSIDREIAVRVGREAPLADLLSAASELRARGKGTIISFSKKVFIPLTTLCRDYCGYCTFRKDPGQPGAHFMTPDEVLALAKEARDAGCKEALFSLGDQPERIFPEARESLAAARVLRARWTMPPRCLKWFWTAQVCCRMPIPA